MKTGSLVSVVLSLALLGGCAVTQQRTSVALEGGGKVNLTEVNWGDTNPLVGGGVNKHYVNEVLDAHGKQMNVGVYAKTTHVSTGQQVIANLPGVIGGVIASNKRGDDLVQMSKIDANARRYAVDNTEPTRVYYDNREWTIATTEVDFDLDQSGCQMGSCE